MNPQAGTTSEGLEPKGPASCRRPAVYDNHGPLAPFSRDCVLHSHPNPYSQRPILSFLRPRPQWALKPEQPSRAAADSDDAAEAGRSTATPNRSVETLARPLPLFAAGARPLTQNTPGLGRATGLSQLTPFRDTRTVRGAPAFEDDMMSFNEWLRDQDPPWTIPPETLPHLKSIWVGALHYAADAAFAAAALQDSLSSNGGADLRDFAEALRDEAAAE